MGDMINHQKATQSGPNPEHNEERVPGKDDELAEHDALEQLTGVFEDIAIVGPKELTIASNTATAILEAMQQLSIRLAASTQDTRDGPAPDYYGEQLAHLAHALESVTHLIEVYSDLAMEE